MAWTALTSPMFTVGQVVTAAQMNALSDNLRYLKGTDGAIVLDNNVAIGTSGAAPSTTLQVLGNIRAGTNNTALASIQRAITIRGAADNAAFAVEAAGTSGRSWGFFTTDTSSTTSLLGAAGSLTIFDQTANLPAMTIDGSRRVGVGTIAPQALLHVKEGTGGSMVFSAKTGIVGTTITILPAGTVTRAVVAFGVADNGAGASAVWPGTIMTVPGGSISVTMGAVTLQLNLYGDSSVGLIRSAGTTACSAAVILVYI